MSQESPVAADTPTSTALVGDALIDAVRRQIEYYFSKENLQNDVYLQQHMDAQMAVPISVVMKFAKLKALTTDEAVVRKALENSAVSIVDNKIRANIKSTGRSTVILRDIPQDTPEEEVREIFNYDGSRAIVSIHSDVGDTWFVSFEGEEDAKQTLLDLRLKKRTFRGVSVKARMKTEQVVRSYFTVNSAPPVLPLPPLPNVPFPLPFPPMVPEMLPYGFMVPPIVDPIVPPPENFAPPKTDDADNAESATSATTETSPTAASANAANADSSSKGNSADKARKPAGRPAQGPQGSARPDSSAGRGRNSHSSSTNQSHNTSSSSASGARGSGKKTAAEVVKPPVEIDAINFPPLAVADDTPVPTPGYKTDYHKYTIDDVIAIVKSSVHDATLPAEVQAGAHPLAMTADANLDLLKRQRTFTIDETREQLRQGRPVTSGLLFGAVDYRSLHYGDDVHHFHALHTIEEKNEALNTSSEALHVSQLDMSMEAADKLDQSFVDPPANTSSTVGAVSPARLNAASWAALVKSAAETPSAFPAMPAAVPVATQTVKKAPVVASAPATNQSNQNNSQGKGGKSNDKRGKDEKKNKGSSGGKSSSGKGNAASNSSQGGRKANESTTADTGAQQQPLLQQHHVQQDNKTEGEDAGQGSGSGWGGKSSFASVLKQKLSEEETTTAVTAPATRPAPVSAPASSHASRKEKESGNRSGHHGREKGERGDRGDRDHFRNGYKGKVAEVDGVWAKETLPPLPKHPKAEALRDTA